MPSFKVDLLAPHIAGTKSSIDILELPVAEWLNFSFAPAFNYSSILAVLLLDVKSKTISVKEKRVFLSKSDVKRENEFGPNQETLYYEMCLKTNGISHTPISVKLERLVDQKPKTRLL